MRIKLFSIILMLLFLLLLWPRQAEKEACACASSFSEGFNKQNFNAVLLGFDTFQVKNLLGEPFIKTTTINNTIEWHYSDDHSLKGAWSCGINAFECWLLYAIVFNNQGAVISRTETIIND